MAQVEVKVPDIGGYDDVPVIEVLVAVGDTVARDQGLVTLESDKATMEVPSTAAGVIAELRVKVGDTLSEGAVVAVIETGEASVSAESSAPSSGQKVAPGSKPPVAPSPRAPAEPEPLQAAGPSGRQADVECSVLVLGAGPGGYTAAFRAADLGLDTVLVERYAAADGVELAERVSGDTSVGHALAYCQAIETLASTGAPARARYLRVILLELERLYNHVGDFGMIANDTGYAVAHSHCFRIRERLLRLNKRLTGHRLLRGALVPGGVRIDLLPGLDVAGEVRAALADFDEIVEISLQSSLVDDRLEGTGQLTTAIARDHGVLGFVARASGLDVDARRDHPFAAYPELMFGVPVLESGDVKARTLVRVREARESVRLIEQAVAMLPGGPLVATLGPLPAHQPAFALVEAWRGRIVHWVMTDGDGRLERVKVLDPSFLNWRPLSYALLKNIVPDFPLCNKSFNQSYSGNDL